jgi:hypothetical protein
VRVCNKNGATEFVRDTIQPSRCRKGTGRVASFLLFFFLLYFQLSQFVSLLGKKQSSKRVGGASKIEVFLYVAAVQTERCLAAVCRSCRASTRTVFGFLTRTKRLTDLYFFENGACLFIATVARVLSACQAEALEFV